MLPLERQGSWLFPTAFQTCHLCFNAKANQIRERFQKSQIWSLSEHLKSTHNGVQVSADSWFWTTPGKSSCPLWGCYHREISKQVYYMKSYGNIRVALRLWQMFWKCLEMSRSRLERMRSSWNIETSGRFVSHPEISVLKPSREFWDHLEISQITPKFLCYGPI